jgi:hypothetical protein
MVDLADQLFPLCPCVNLCHNVGKKLGLCYFSNVKENIRKETVHITHLEPNIAQIKDNIFQITFYGL